MDRCTSKWGKLLHSMVLSSRQLLRGIKTYLPIVAAVFCTFWLLSFRNQAAARLVLVGDVHGCSTELHDLLQAVNFKRGSDRLILLGDLIGKGPHPKDVISIAQYMDAQAVQGNHEFNLLQWRARGSPLPDPEGKIQAAYLSTVSELEEEDWQWLKSLPYYLKLDLPKSAGQVVAVHGGLVPGVALDEQQPEELVHLRSFDHLGNPSERFDAGAGPWAKAWPGPEQVVFGHDARRGLQTEGFALGLDTGVVYGGSLTAFLVKTDTATSVLPPLAEALVSVPARMTYVEPGNRNRSRS